MNNLYDALEICLQEIEKGADLEAVLRRFPDLTEELRPILQTSVEARSIVVTGPAPDMVRRGRAKVLQQAAHLREEKASSSRRVWSVPLRRMLVSMTVIAALFVTSTGLVRAASTTLPGDNLYPVKRTWEDVLTLFTFNLQARQALEVQHENERLEELYELFAAGRSAEVDFAGTITRQNGDLWLVSKVPVVISAQTDLRDLPIQIGDAVRVRGISQPDGTVLADRVDRLSDGSPLPDTDDDDPFEFEHEGPGNENEAADDHSGSGSGDETPQSQATQIFEPEQFSREGVVDSINGNVLVVNGQPMNLTGAEIRGTPAVGASVKVDGYFDANGIFIVTRIEFRNDNSGSDSNSNSNENNNDDDSSDDNDNSGDDDDNNDDNSGKDNENDDDSNDDSGGDDD